MCLLCCAVLTLLSFAKADKWCCNQPDTLDAKIAKVVLYANPNNDSMYDVFDVVNNLETNFDKNHDNKTSLVEWALTRDCLFGDSFAFTLKSFRSLDTDNDGFITRGEILQSPLAKAPEPLATYIAGLQSMVEKPSGGTVIGR